MTGARETANQLDAAIDALIEGPAGPRSMAEGELTTTARVLREALPRFHPRFSFEDHLAARLAVLTRPSSPISIPPPTPIREGVAVAEPSAPAAAPVTTAERRRRGLVAGGAIASGVSLAIPIGAAIVVWRRSRSSGGIL